MNNHSDLRQPRSAEELIAILERECAERRDNVRIAKLGSVSLVLGLFALALAAFLIKGTPFTETLTNFSAFFLVALGGVALKARHRNALLQVQGSDPRLAGFLIEALSYRDQEVIEHSERILVDQLPHVGSLTTEHNRLLSARLANSKNHRFVHAALEALRSHSGPESLEGITAFIEQEPPAQAREKWQRLETLALNSSADIRLRSAKTIIESEAQKAQLRMHLGGAPQANGSAPEDHQVDLTDGAR